MELIPSALVRIKSIMPNTFFWTLYKGNDKALFYSAQHQREQETHQVAVCLQSEKAYLNGIINLNALDGSALVLPSMTPRVDLNGQVLSGEKMWSPPVGALVVHNEIIGMSIHTPNGYSGDGFILNFATGQVEFIDDRGWLAFAKWALGPHDPTLPTLFNFEASTPETV